MADQDFKINIVTLADTTGIKLTQQQLEALQTAAKQGNAEAISALKRLSDAQKEAVASSKLSNTGSAVGVGTIVTLLTSAIHKWKEFNEEQDKIIDKMFEATVKMREEALAVAEIKDLDFSDELIKQANSIDELNANAGRLTQKIRELKSEQAALDPLTQAEEWKKLRTEIQAYQSQLNSVTSSINQQTAALQKKNAEAEKAAILAEREAQSFLKNAVQTAQPNVQAALKNEEKAREARQAGFEKDADLLQKTADQFKKSFTPAEQEEYEGFTKSTRLGRKAGPGESQDIIDEQARNKINFDRQLQGLPPLPAQAQGNQDLSQAIISAFDATMSKYFGP